MNMNIALLYFLLDCMKFLYKISRDTEYKKSKNSIPKK